MPIVLFNHARIGVTQILRHHEQRHAIHHGVACPRVPEPVETDRWVDPSVDAGFRHRAEVGGWPPGFARRPRQHDFASGTADGELPEKEYTLIAEHHVARLA